jgi:gluconate kinase
MPPALLGSQLATLEEPGADEDALVLPPAAPDLMLAQARAWLRQTPAAPR